MSLTLRKAASSLVRPRSGSQRDGVTWAASSTAQPGEAQLFKLSPSQVKARSSGKQERMVVVFDNQLTNLPANGGPPARPRSKGRVDSGSTRSPAEAGRGHAYRDPFDPQRCGGGNAGRPRYGHSATPRASRRSSPTGPSSSGTPRRARRRWPPPRCGSRPSRQRRPTGSNCAEQSGKPLVEPEALTSIHATEAFAIATRQGVIVGNVDADTLAENWNMTRPERAARDHRCPGPDRERLQRRVHRDVSTIAAQARSATPTRLSCPSRISPRTAVSESWVTPPAPLLSPPVSSPTPTRRADRGSRVAGHRRVAGGGEQRCQRRVGVLRLWRAAGCQRRPARADERRHGCSGRCCRRERGRAAARPARSRPLLMTPTSSTPPGRTTCGSWPRPMATPRAGKTTT